MSDNRLESIDAFGDRPWRELLGSQLTPGSELAKLVDILGEADPSDQCEFLWQQVFPTVPYSVHAIRAWLKTEHGIANSQVGKVSFITILELLKAKLAADTSVLRGQIKKSRPQTDDVAEFYRLQKLAKWKNGSKAAIHREIARKNLPEADHAQLKREAARIKKAIRDYERKCH